MTTRRTAVDINMAAWLELLPMGLLLLVAMVTSVHNSFQNQVEEEPLLLTPLLERGHIEKARNLSAVNGDTSNRIPPGHAGFLTVDRKFKNHLFFWYFPSLTDPKAPLLVWLNGGPAVSSMLGLLWEHGPLEVMNTSGRVTYGLRNHSWVGAFSVVYVDNPVGTGYSFSESGARGYKLTQVEYTDDMFNFVTQFVKMFPEYTGRGVYIGGQSYAGKYVPALAHRIHERRVSDKHARNIDLRGVILGGPYFDPETESVAFYRYLYALGAISHADKIRYTKRVKNMYQTFLDGGMANATFSDLFQVLVLQNEVPLPSLDNYVTGKEADYKAVFEVMDSLEIRLAVHAGIKTKFHESNTELSQLYGPDVLVSTKDKLAQLLNHYKVLIYNGDYDVVVSSVMVETALLATSWKHQDEYTKAKRKTWNRSKDRKLLGFYSQVGDFCRVVVHGAGHQTPHDAPEACHEMVTLFLKHGCLTLN